MKCYLAVDLGSSSERVLAGSFNDGNLELKEMHRFWNGAGEKEDGLLDGNGNLVNAPFQYRDVRTDREGFSNRSSGRNL